MFVYAFFIDVMFSFSYFCKVVTLPYVCGYFERIQTRWDNHKNKVNEREADIFWVTEKEVFAFMHFMNSVNEIIEKWS